MSSCLYVHKARGFGASSSIRLAARAVTTSLVFAGMLWLGISVYLVGSKGTETGVGDDFSPRFELAWSSGRDGRRFLGQGEVTINVEAYNRRREKQIADASRKLLLLAISLKSELEDTPASGLSLDAIKKAKEIEKLAHDVKEMMRIDIVSSQDRVEIP
jgi:hypothetical protein